MAKRRYKIKGTKDFLVMAVFCAFLCVWAIRDAWFPTQKTLEKYPPEVEVGFELPGVIREIRVEPGQRVEGEMVLAVLHDEPVQARIAEAEEAFRAARDARDPEAEALLEALNEVRADLAKCTLRNTDVMIATSYGEAPLRGNVARIVRRPGERVEAGAPVLVIEPQHTFYVFNKSLAVISFIGMIIALFFHWIASK